MSLIDPSTRWWNSYRVRGWAARACWVVSMTSCFVIGWSFIAGVGPADETSGWLFSALLPLSVLLIIAGAFLHLASDPGGRSEDWNPRIIFLPIAGSFFFQGAGAVARAVSEGVAVRTFPAVLAAVGLVAAVLVEVISRRVESVRARRGRVARSGITTRGTVTRTRGYSLNESRVSRVTVTFTDAAGRQRWASQTVAGPVRVGARMTVQYLPGELGRRGGVVLDA